MRSPRTFFGWVFYTCFVLLVTPPLLAVVALCLYVSWFFLSAALVGLAGYLVG